MDITISTSAKNANEGRALLSAFNFPFKNQSQPKLKDESLEIKKESEDNPDQQGAEAE